MHFCLTLLLAETSTRVRTRRLKMRSSARVASSSRIQLDLKVTRFKCIAEVQFARADLL